ncbi:hypothetical protein E3_1280 [Rhodococcus phage E3]|uniref:hypothetical protein n=1 Tax=Rhodococcus phage E3 TaxID=1007869 RepID=UPI0002C6A86D|nr:hypothetical protein M176_gp135 [Rhodococcus phage E3]AEQ21043.1 hypothetical protein E3_1280 [Rhodococcus phage E3]
MDTTLNTIMELGTVVEIDPEGEPTVRRDLHAPEVYQNLDDSGSVTGEPEVGGGWTLLTNFSGQDRYRGAGMHSSESIGGGLEDFIRANPGLYVAVLVSYLGPEEEYEPDSWVTAFKPLDHDDDRHTECDADVCTIKSDALRAAEGIARCTGSTGATHIVEKTNDKGIRYTKVSATWTRKDNA